ncbi:MAG: hypothetical protein GX971_03340 [Firmicutes bacterium]|nr:hypothetical protein [Bacillota bacterium]
MNYSMAFLSWFTPIILTTLVVVLVIALRWFSYKERMAMIAQGLSIEEKGEQPGRHKLLLAIGIVLGLVGLALTIGLLTIGMGPWLLVGLIPLFAGLALILTSLVLRPDKPQPVVEPEEILPPQEPEVPEFIIQEEGEEEKLA